MYNRQCIKGVFFILDVIIKEVNEAPMKYEVTPFKAERTTNQRRTGKKNIYNLSKYFYTSIIVYEFPLVTYDKNAHAL